MNKTQELQRSPVRLSVKGLFRYPVKCFEWNTSAVAQSTNDYKLRKSSPWSSSFVKMPSSFSNSSRKQWTVSFPIVMSDIHRFSWATIRQVFTKPSYSDPLFLPFFTAWNRTFRHLFCRKFEFCVIFHKPVSSCLMFWQPFVLLANQIILNILTSALIGPNYRALSEYKALCWRHFSLL